MKKIQIGGHRKSKNIDRISDIKFVTVDDEDFNWLNQWKWSIHNKGYAYRWENRECILMHRLIAERYGIVKKDQHIDHINTIKSDNRKCNLRAATIQENNRNRGKSRQNTNLFKGITKSGNNKKPYKASIWVDNKRIHLGCFTFEIDAALAYDRAAIKYHQAFANINFLNVHLKKMREKKGGSRL